jgi:hypothetical protein
VVLPLYVLALVLCAALAGWAAWFVVRDRAVVLLVASLTVAFLQWRLWIIWEGGA